jgi:hypothetical protein
VMDTKQLVPSAGREQKWPRIATQEQSDGFGYTVIFLVLATNLLVRVAATKMCLERTKIRECPESHYKSDEIARKGIDNWRRRMLPNCLRTLIKVSEIKFSRRRL